MRFSKVSLGLLACGVSAGALWACGGNSVVGGGGTGPTTSSSEDSSLSSSSSSSSSSPACSPKAACTADHECFGETNNTGKTSFGMRIIDLHLAKPAALATGLLGSVVTSRVVPADTDCKLAGTGTFSWLLQFDTVAGTLKTGGAKPVTDLSQGQSFVDETQGAFHIQPTILEVTPDADGKFSVATGADMTIPVYLDAAAQGVVLLPLKAARFIDGQISTSQNCIGSYNAAGLDPVDDCKSDATHPAFNTGGAIDAYIRLEDADAVTVVSLNSSLCALLAGLPEYVEKVGATTMCKRDGTTQAILFQGDWCGATNAAATVTCRDSVKLTATYAAAAIAINN